MYVRIKRLKNKKKKKKIWIFHYEYYDGKSLTSVDEKSGSEAKKSLLLTSFFISYYVNACVYKVDFYFIQWLYGISCLHLLLSYLLHIYLHTINNVIEKYPWSILKYTQERKSFIRTSDDNDSVVSSLRKWMPSFVFFLLKEWLYYFYFISATHSFTWGMKTSSKIDDAS